MWCRAGTHAVASSADAQAAPQNVVQYTGSGADRQVIRDWEFGHTGQRSGRCKFHVLLTSYELVLRDKALLTKCTQCAAAPVNLRLPWRICARSCQPARVQPALRTSYELVLRDKALLTKCTQCASSMDSRC